MNELELIEAAIEKLEHETGKSAKVLKVWGTEKGGEADALLELAGEEIECEVKKWAQNIDFGALVYQMKSLPKKSLLIATYINSKMAKRLKEEDVQFLDTAGNTYINIKNFYVYIRGNERPIDLQTDPKTNISGRAFKPTGMKVVFALLKDQVLINEPYRRIASRTDVALGTVGWVMSSLRGLGFVRQAEGQKTLRNSNELLKLWTESYRQQIKQKHFLGAFVTDLNNTEIKLPRSMMSKWGGEAAAGKITGYLRPKVSTIYTRESVGSLVKLFRLRKAPHPSEANFEIYKPFWPFSEDEPGDTVHPLVIYADLISSGDARNIETARLIYDDILYRYIEQA